MNLHLPFCLFQRPPLSSMIQFAATFLCGGNRKAAFLERSGQGLEPCRVFYSTAEDLPPKRAVLSIEPPDPIVMRIYENRCFVF